MRRSRLGLIAVLALLVSTFASTVSAQEYDYQPIATSEFEDVWERTDLPVQEGQAVRTWIWGPGGYTGLLTEPYTEADGGERQVQYFDKSRMEMPLNGGDPDSPWFVTQGLLATELMTGRLQLGHNDFEQHQPADIPVAGDPDDVFGPTYATMGNFMDWGARPAGSTITQVLTSDGTVFDNDALSVYGVTDAHYDPVTQHNIASVFWDFMNSQGTIYENGQYVEGDIFENPYYAVGRPLTEAYWGWVKVNNVEQNVLIQCFERRCLTYTPDNPEGWQVESGNIGQHYYHWRYEILPGISEATSFDVEPESATNTVGDTHDITVTVLDQHGDPYNGAAVEAEVTETTGDTEAHLGETMSGISGDDGDGTVVLSYDGSEIGEDTITVSVDGIEESQTVTKTWVGEDPASIEISQDDDEHVVGEDHTVTATVEDDQGNPVSDGTEIEFNITGANNHLDGVADTEDGIAEFTYTGEDAGTDTVVASWDGVQSNTLNVSWEPGEPANIVLAQTENTNFINSDHEVTAHVNDEFGNSVDAGYDIVLVVDGVHQEEVFDQTATNGVAVFEYTGTEPGEDTITAYWDEDDDGDQDAGEDVESEDALTKTWEVNPPESSLDMSDLDGSSVGDIERTESTVSNPAEEAGGVTYDNVRFDITVELPSGEDCTGDAWTDWFEYTDTSSQGGLQGINTTFDCVNGSFEGHWGPETGFQMQAGYDATTWFDIEVKDEAAAGTYTSTVELVTVDSGDGSVIDVLDSASDSFEIVESSP